MIILLYKYNYILFVGGRKGARGRREGGGWRESEWARACVRACVCMHAHPLIILDHE